MATKKGNGSSASTSSGGNEHPSDALRRFKEEAAAHLKSLEERREVLAEQVEAGTRELAEIDASLKEIRRLVEGPKKRAPGKRKKRGEEEPAQDEGEELEASDDGDNFGDDEELAAEATA